MPQTTYLPAYKADYPITAKVQKPGGVTVSVALIATAVPNKPTYVAGTIQSLEEYLVAVAEWDAQRAQEAAAGEPAEEEHEEVEEDDGNGGTVKRRRPRSRR